MLDALHHSVTRLFDVLLAPIERIGVPWVILLVGAVFGVLALWIFKWISPQRAIRNAKARIQGHMIEIRLYQEDLGLVSRAIGKVLLLNVRYLLLNLLPFLPLSLPFVVLAGQLVVRYGFDPVPIREENSGLAGDGITLNLTWDPALSSGAQVELPGGLFAVSPLVVTTDQGRAWQEVRATQAGLNEIQVEVGGERVLKRLYAGTPDGFGSPRVPIQGVRTSGLDAWLWPAEDSLPGAGLTRVEFTYPNAKLGWLPGSGPGAVLLWFVVSSMVAGVLALKPLKVTI
ncbi:MAG: hypothetical protein R3F17_08770 [Planctomycetota bacterium]